MNPTRILFFNPYFGGHYIEYVVHLLRYLNSNRQLFGSIVFTVILPQECSEDVAEFENLELNIVYLKEPLQRYQNVPVEQQVQILESTCQSENIDIVFFPHLERAIHVLPRLKLNDAQYSGIIFTTFNRFGFPNENLFVRLYRSARFLGRRMLDTYRLLGRKKWAHVFLLNDNAAPDWYRKLPFLKVKKFSSIVDPVEFAPLPPKNSYSLSEYGLCESKPVVTCVGDLRERKNAHTLIEAFSVLEEQGCDVQLLIVGSGDKEYTKRIRDMIGSGSCSTVQFHDRYPDDREFRWIIDNSDVVAIPYIDFFRSSGVLNHAMRSRTKILCGNVGLIHHAVEKSGLGMGVNPKDPVDIARGIMVLTGDFEFSEEKVLEYAKSNNPDPKEFAKEIFEKLIGANDFNGTAIDQKIQPIVER